MPRANSTQSSFLGGEWSPAAQGRTDLPAYPSALNVCRNGYPQEEGAWTRRPGFLELGAAYMGSVDTVSVDFNLATGPVVYLEETLYNGHIYFRFWTDLSALFAANTYGGAPLALLPDQIQSVSSISTDNPAVLTVGGTPNWPTGTVIQLYLDQSIGINAPALMGRQLIVTNVNTSTYTLADMVTGDTIDGSATANLYAGGTSYAARPVTLFTEYTQASDLTGSAALTGIRVVQTGQEALILSANYQPGLLILGSTIASVAGITIPFSFSFGYAGFVGTSNTTDGPYADPLPGLSQTGNALATIGGDGETFTITDGSYVFQSTDIGRQVRAWIQPLAWDATVQYSPNVSVTFGGIYYVMTYTSLLPVGIAPNQAYVVNGVSYFPWTLSPQLGGWKAGTITAINGGGNSNICQVNFNLGAWNCPNTIIDTWQLGLYTATGPSWPSCGTYHEGRLALGGLFPGRFDLSATVPGYAVTWFQPTDYFGEVTDANAIGYTLNTPPQSNLIWMVTDVAGIIAGTAGDEWLISAPETNGAISPSNIQGRRISRYGSAAIDPIRAGLAIIFVQQQQRQLIEYIPDPFAQRYVGWRLNTLAKHLTTDGLTPKGIIGVTYQEEPTPILWVTLADSSLIGCTYRRQSTFGSEPPFFFGWHRHDYGFAPQDPGIGKNIMGGSPGPGGTTGGSLVVSTSLNSVGYLEIMSSSTGGGNLDGSPAGWITGSDNNGGGGGGSDTGSVQFWYAATNYATTIAAGTTTPTGGSGNIQTVTQTGSVVCNSDGSITVPAGTWSFGMSAPVYDWAYNVNPSGDVVGDDVVTLNIIGGSGGSASFPLDTWLGAPLEVTATITVGITTTFSCSLTMTGSDNFSASDSQFASFSVASA